MIENINGRLFSIKSDDENEKGKIIQSTEQLQRTDA